MCGGGGGRAGIIGSGRAAPSGADSMERVDQGGDGGIRIAPPKERACFHHGSPTTTSP